MNHSRVQAGEATLSTEEMIALERICDRFEEACRRGDAVDPAAVMAEAAIAIRQALVRELLLIEVAYRPADRRATVLAAYLARFPEYATAIVADAPDTSTPAGNETGPEPTCLYQPDAAPLPAAIGGFRVLHELGRGGMGVVYAAEDPALGRTVAVKTLTPALAADPHARDRFLREARAAAAVEHDQVVPVYHVGEDPVGPYLVMPLLAGQTLADLLKSGPLSLAELLRVGRETALGLAAAHAAGLVHRDVKPSNVWLDADRGGRARVLDFGLARAADGTDSLTRPGDLRGTPRYMAPEQARGNPVDPRTDLFALGATLYHAATGSPPFAGSTYAAVLDAVIHQNPPPAHERNPAVPPAVSALLARLLAKEPCDRPESAEAVAAELATLAANIDHLPAAPSPVPRSDRVRRWKVAVPICAILVVVAAVGLAGKLGPPQADLSTTNPAPSTPPTDAEASRASPLVTEIKVRPHAPLGDGLFSPLHLLGPDNQAATSAQAITVEVTLSRPAYSFIVLFRADGQEVLLDPQDNTDVPVKTDRPHYPSKRRDALYLLDDGPGLWAVAVIASDDPLPGYRDWRAKHPGGPWRAISTPAPAVVFDDGQFLRTFAAGQTATRGSRGEVSGAGRKPVVTLVDWLTQQGGSAAAIAFPVIAAK